MAGLNDFNSWLNHARSVAIGFTRSKGIIRPDDVEDFVEDVITELIEKERGRFGSWLMMSKPSPSDDKKFFGLLKKVIDFRSKDYLRKKAREKSFQASVECDGEIAEKCGDATFGELDLQDLYSALAQLPDDERELIEDRFFEELILSELAKKHDCAIDTIRRRIIAIGIKLRKLLEESDS